MVILLHEQKNERIKNTLNFTSLDASTCNDVIRTDLALRLYGPSAAVQHSSALSLSRQVMICNCFIPQHMQVVPGGTGQT